MPLPPLNIPIKAGTRFLVRRERPDCIQVYEDALVPGLFSFSLPDAWEAVPCPACGGKGYHGDPTEPTVRRAVLEGFRGVAWCSACLRTGVDPKLLPVGNSNALG
jgi:hypothetical protein